jgi:hypothetical protein
MLAHLYGNTNSVGRQDYSRSWTAFVLTKNNEIKEDIPLGEMDEIPRSQCTPDS